MVLLVTLTTFTSPHTPCLCLDLLLGDWWSSSRCLLPDLLPGTVGHRHSCLLPRPSALALVATIISQQKALSDVLDFPMFLSSSQAGTTYSQTYPAFSSPGHGLHCPHSMDHAFPSSTSSCSPSWSLALRGTQMASLGVVASAP